MGQGPRAMGHEQAARPRFTRGASRVHSGKLHGSKQGAAYRKEHPRLGLGRAAARQRSFAVLFFTHSKYKLNRRLIWRAVWRRMVQVPKANLPASASARECKCTHKLTRLLPLLLFTTRDTELLFHGRGAERAKGGGLATATRGSQNCVGGGATRRRCYSAALASPLLLVAMLVAQ